MVMGVVVGVIVIVIVVLLIPKKGGMAKKYLQASEMFEKGDLLKAMSIMFEVVVFSMSGKYTYEDAGQVIKGLKLFKTLLQEQGINKDEMINPVIQALEGITEAGGKINPDLTEELDNFIQKMSSSVGNQANILLQEARMGNIGEVEGNGDEDFTDDIVDQKEFDSINAVGKYLLSQKYKEGIRYIDDILPQEMSPFKAALLDQKASLYFMSGVVKDAVVIYREILNSYPSNNRIRSALSEGLVELKETDEAVKHAELVIQSSRDKDLLKTSQKIINQYKK